MPNLITTTRGNLDVSLDVAEDITDIFPSSVAVVKAARDAVRAEIETLRLQRAQINDRVRTLLADERRLARMARIADEPTTTQEETDQ